MKQKSQLADEIPIDLSNTDIFPACREDSKGLGGEVSAHRIPPLQREYAVEASPIWKALSISHKFQLRRVLFFQFFHLSQGADVSTNPCMHATWRKVF